MGAPEFKERRLKHPHFCPGCSAPMTGGTGNSKRTEAPGDFSVCAYCGTIGVYTDAMAIREATDADLDAYPMPGRAELIYLSLYFKKHGRPHSGIKEKA